MSLVKFTISEEDKKRTKEELLAEFEAEIDKFSEFMASIKDWRFSGSLIKGERALLKTYLIYKTDLYDKETQLPERN